MGNIELKTTDGGEVLYGGPREGGKKHFLKQMEIEKMAKEIESTIELRECESWHCNGCQYEKYSENYMCDSIKQAEHLYNAGYRKQSEGEWKWISDDDCRYITLELLPQLRSEDERR